MAALGADVNMPIFFSTVIDDATKEIVYRDYVDISVAVSTPKVRSIMSPPRAGRNLSVDASTATGHGRCVTLLSFLQGLVVPVIRGVEGMNFADIEKTINMLGEKVLFIILCSYYLFFSLF